ncbi:MAG: ParA family protein [Richelia sp. RM2_1_2]|nr:ParA family protein [Richelia sp. SM2_1_7]NJM22396.1 ParA family protein [Richelia sp. SM1_7_0]NJN09479.1 ParA family protein [Richelia sp. RM1_1_1]NJO26858.1 ParA family protein [Richelia sp. SL_2_1]NJO58744.1 ParA family protein [Richelia sp. RM2_1_2]
MTCVITLFNQSGGVGKSSLAMNLAYHIQERNRKVLVVDMDPQSSLTVFMGLDPTSLTKTVYDSILHSSPLPIHENIHGIDLAPANINLSAAELELVVADLRDMRLKEALEPILDQYDFILIDCPPSLGLLSYISLVASTHVLVPIQTQYKAFCGTELLLNTVARVRSRPNKKLQIAGFIPTMYDGRNVQDARTLQAIKEQLQQVGVIYPPIPRSTAFADASEDHVPLAVLNRKHPAVPILKKIASRLEKII